MGHGSPGVADEGTHGMTQSTVKLGYAIGTGEPVNIPIAHTFVTGQTQLSGKTTTLRAIVGRSERRALAFVTKRGEHFDGRRIRPYLPREGEHPIHWRLVETILASALGQRSLKYERLWIVNAAKGAKSLADVRRNVDRLKAKAKGNSGDVYMLLGEYLDLVLPEMRQLGAADLLDLKPGLNVMDLGGVGPQLQALVIRAALERINVHEKGVLTVFPEAWEFAPRNRSAPAKDEAIAMARKGAVLGNFLLCDSQDIAGVDTVVRQAASVWILGVQRELNELKRTIDSIPAGVAKPKPSEVATLDRGQFFVCYGRHVIKTYVQPMWMPDYEAKIFAMRGESPPPSFEPKKEPTAVTNEEADHLREVNRELREQFSNLEQQLAELHNRLAGRTGPADSAPPPANRPPPPPAAPPGNRSISLNGGEAEPLYQWVLDRLLKEPAVLSLNLPRPEIHVTESREVIEADGKTLRGRLALMLHDGFFDEPTTSGIIQADLTKRGFNTAAPNIAKELAELASMGFVTRDNKWWRAVEGIQKRIIRK
jgi:hypothetical protein